jgi:hypothetical protein
MLWMLWGRLVHPHFGEFDIVLGFLFLPGVLVSSLSVPLSVASVLCSFAAVATPRRSWLPGLSLVLSGIALVLCLCARLLDG